MMYSQIAAWRHANVRAMLDLTSSRTYECHFFIHFYQNNFKINSEKLKKNPENSKIYNFQNTTPFLSNIYEKLNNLSFYAFYFKK